MILFPFILFRVLTNVYEALIINDVARCKEKKMSYVRKIETSNTV